MKRLQWHHRCWPAAAVKAAARDRWGRFKVGGTGLSRIEPFCLCPLHTGNCHGGVWKRGVRIEWDQQQRDGQAMKSGFRKLGISMDIPCIYDVNTSINMPCIYLDIPCIYLVDIHCDWHPSHDNDRAKLISKTHLVCNLSLSKMQRQSRRLI